MAVPLGEIVLLALFCTVGLGTASYVALKRLREAERREAGDVELQNLHRDEDYRDDDLVGQGTHGNIFLPQGL